MKTTKTLRKVLLIVFSAVIAMTVMLIMQMPASAAVIGEDIVGIENNLSAVADQTGTYDGYQYEIIETEEGSQFAIITGYTGSEPYLYIPDEINGCYVKGIAESAFEGNKNIKSVKIPKYCFAIGHYAFLDCTNLVRVNVIWKSTPMYIGDGAFYNTAWYNDSKNWIDNVLYLSDAAVDCKTSVTSVKLKDDTESIAELAFADCTNLTSVDMSLCSDTLIYVSPGAFMDVPKLKSITIPDSVQTIGGYAFGFTFDEDKKDVVKVPGFKVCGSSYSLAKDYAEYYGFTYECTNPLKLNKGSITLGNGEIYKLEPNDRVKNYSSSNKSVAVVGDNGEIEARGTGSATITAVTNDGRRATCKVTVKNAPTSMSLNKEYLVLGTGKQFDLDSSLPSGQGAYSIVYSSSNTKVAEVKASGGIVTAKSTGKAVITAKAFNGVKTECIVYVNSGEKQGADINLNTKVGSNTDTYSKTFKNVDVITVPGHTFSVYKWDEWNCKKSDYVDGYVSSRVVKNSNGTYTLYLWSRASSGTGNIKTVYNNGEVINYEYTVAKQGESITLNAKVGDKTETYSKTFKNVKTITVPGHTFSVGMWDEWNCTKSDYVEGYISSRVVKNSDGTFTLNLWSRASLGTGNIKAIYNNGEIYSHKYTVEGIGESIILSVKINDKPDTYAKTFKDVKSISVPGHTFSVYMWDEWNCTKSDYVEGYISSRVVKNSDGTYTLYLWSRANTGTGTIKVSYSNGEVYNHTYAVEPAQINTNPEIVEELEKKLADKIS